MPSMTYFPRNIGLLIIPSDELIFFRGVAQLPTSKKLEDPQEIYDYFTTDFRFEINVWLNKKGNIADDCVNE